jgi:maltose O-acetyltransferase
VVVGAGSVVTGELPDHSVAVGNPARVVRATPGQCVGDAGDG